MPLESGESEHADPRRDGTIGAVIGSTRSISAIWMLSKSRSIVQRVDSGDGAVYAEEHDV